MPRLLSQPSRNVKPFRPACRSRKCTPRLFVPKNHLAASFGTDQSAAMSGGHRNAIPEQLGERITRRYDRSLRRRLAAAGNARAEAELDRHRRGLARSPTSSQRDMGAGPRRSGIRCRRRHYHFTVVNSATISATANIKTAASKSGICHMARGLSFVRWPLPASPPNWSAPLPH
jgi:hypothetical protein